MSPPDQVVQQFTQAIGSGNANAITSLFASNLKLNIPGAQGAGPESVGGGGSVSPAGATTPGAANVKILDSFSAGDRVVTRFQYNVKGSDVEGGGSGSA
ncbi:MAG: nuclear transport factor 2 family protein, partial [Thermoanaerobaculia bacterium]